MRSSGRRRSVLAALLARAALVPLLAAAGFGLVPASFAHAAASPTVDRTALATAVSSRSAASTAVALPTSIGAAGDSITRAFDSAPSCFLRDCPQNSWSTGDQVQSHYLRLLALNPALRGRAFSLARTGAKMADLPGQLLIAGAYHVDYVTVLMGANDLCTSSAATMTPTGTFLNQVWLALYYYFQQNPSGHVFMSSIPDLYQLWSDLHTNQNALNTWSIFSVCQSMLSSSNTEADRQAVVKQEVLDNMALRYACSLFPGCRHDGYATFFVHFPASEVSTIDYFHPNVTGESDLAGVTWASSYWSTS